MATPRKEFGKRNIKPPPLITHAPQGLAGGPNPLAPTQMRTLAITLGLLGVTAIGVFAAAQAHHRRENCAPPEGSNPDGSILSKLGKLRRTWRKRKLVGIFGALWIFGIF